ncbi:uncharacterized protein [Temnothorax nylanderi]|uniref:uncharacterized protein n=1 Tax=Temnothorax nylanderi TaxID=102681 RepID=UPI003A8C78B3
MFAALLVFTLVTAHAAELPSYIRVCGRKDANYDQCIMENLNSMSEKLCTGMPEFNIPSVEPVVIEKIVIYDTDNLKLSLRDSNISGICDYVVNSIHTDPDRLHFNFDVTFKHLVARTLYDFDIHILVPLANKGLATITSDNGLVKVNMDLKVATKGGKKEIYVSKVNAKAKIPFFNYKFDESEKELVQLHQALSNVVDSNSKDIIAKVEPVLEAKISEIIISIFNNMARSNYEILFPEEA